MPGNCPDVLVLAAGGTLGEAWMNGVLAGMEDAGGIDFRRCDAFVGTSAGAIIAARLAAGRHPRRIRGGAVGDAPASGFTRDAREAPEPPRRRRRSSRAVRGAARVGAFATAPLVPSLLALGAPAGARLRALALARVPDRGERLTRLHQEMAALGTRFDGRLRICAVERDTGRRVVFGRPGAPTASVAEAVTASCSIPWVFRPVRIGGRDYVDGGAWSLTNLDVAPVGRDTEVLCLHPTGSLNVGLDTPIGALRAFAAAAAEVEVLALRARGARVRVLTPDAQAAERMGSNLMDFRPYREVHAAAYQQGLRS
jgi:NTE family protein